MFKPPAHMGLLSVIVSVFAATSTEACIVTRPLPAPVLAQDAARERAAWDEASVVWLAVVTEQGVGDQANTYYRLTRTAVLKGDGAPNEIRSAPLPARGLMCQWYWGLNVEDGAELGSEFVIYSGNDGGQPPLIVSTRQVQDRQTRRAISASRPEN